MGGRYTWMFFRRRNFALPMPIYAYHCDACGHEHDTLQKLSDPVLTVCPACHAERYRRKLTAAGFQLKGTGWYATDFRDSGAKKPASDSEKGGAESQGHKDEASKDNASKDSASKDSTSGGAAAAVESSGASSAGSSSGSAAGSEASGSKAAAGSTGGGGGSGSGSATSGGGAASSAGGSKA